MKKTTIIQIALCLCLFSSCSNIRAIYSISLQKVHYPSHVAQQIGAQTITAAKDIMDLNVYEDDMIKSTWLVSDNSFSFSITNKTQRPIEVNWDNISYVDINGSVGRVTHKNIAYANINNPQPSIFIPSGATLDDLLLPIDILYSVGNRNKLIPIINHNFLFPCIYNSMKAFNAPNGAASYVGKTMQIFIPIVIDNVQYEYTFIFSIDQLLGSNRI